MMISVYTVRKMFTEGCTIEQFASEMGISVEAAEAVKKYVDEDSVPDDSLVTLSEVTFGDGQKLGPGNVVL